MARWVCIVCDYIYDEREGWPDDGIAPGTRWEDVPEDWTCPDCGVGKADFELVAGSEDDDLPDAAGIAGAGSDHTADPDSAPARVIAAPSSVADSDQIVIIGSGMAGYGVAREIRQRDPDVPIVIVSSDGGESYSKPLLSTGYTKTQSAADLVTQTADQMAQKLAISVLTRKRVVGIDREAKRVALSGGEDLPYRDLVLCVGSDSIKPELAGSGAQDILSVNDLDDYARFQQIMKEHGVSNVAIIGAGLIGCEFANDLINGGYSPELIDPMSWCLPGLLPEPCGTAVRQALEEGGARFHFGSMAICVERAGAGFQVELDNGARLSADLVLSAVGVRPRTALAQAAGLEVGKGIKTDQFLQTSDPHIYALGDCAEVCGHVLVYVAPLNKSAKALAATLTGAPTAVEYPAMPVLVKTPSCPVVVSPPPAGLAGNWTIEGDGSDLVATFFGSNGEALGFALTGNAVEEKGKYLKLMPPVLGT